MERYTPLLGACLLTILAGCTTDSIGKSVDTAQVTATGCWTGNILDDEGGRSVEGCGTKTWPVKGSIVSVGFQKKADDAGQLCASLLFEGATVKNQCTTASYGVVNVAA